MRKTGVLLLRHSHGATDYVKAQKQVYLYKSDLFIFFTPHFHSLAMYIKSTTDLNWWAVSLLGRGSLNHVSWKVVMPDKFGARLWVDI